MDELIEGAFKVLMGITLVLVAPVLAVYFAVKGVVWVWSNYWPYLVGGLGFVALVVLAVIAFKATADAREIRASKRRALRHLDIAFNEAASRMEDIARLHPQVSTPNHSILPARRPGK